MNCPLCSAKAVDGAAECPSCGVLFAKLREREEREKLQAKAALASAEAPTPAFNPWRLRLAAAGVVVAWIVAFGLYFRAQMKKAPRRRASPAFSTGSTLLVRDPVTGRMERVEVHSAPRAARPEPPAPLQSAPEKPADAPPYDPDFDD